MLASSIDKITQSDHVAVEDSHCCAEQDDRCPRKCMVPNESQKISVEREGKEDGRVLCAASAPSSWAPLAFNK